MLHGIDFAAGDSYTRDLEPTKQDGGSVWDMFRSCMRVFKTGAERCTNRSESCCRYPPARQWRNVWSLRATDGGSDAVLTANKSEADALLATARYREVCTPAGGSTAFCWPGDAHSVAVSLNISNSISVNLIYSNKTDYYRGPFLLWAGPVGTTSAPIYRCVTRSGTYFVSGTSDCLSLGKTDVTLGWISNLRSSNTPRSLRLCVQPGGGLDHTVDGPCEYIGGHTLEHLGFVH
jgi:hypothetical protein